jgi:hypothetical protein
VNSHKLDLSDTASGLPFASQGRFVLVGREVNTTTGTIQFATEFHNRGSLLRPGGFGRVRICSGRYIEKHKRFAGRTNLAVQRIACSAKTGDSPSPRLAIRSALTRRSNLSRSQSR